MALFVQIDHFRKTDQKPTVKNHLFSISWFRSFNRTSFQQQLKQYDIPRNIFRLSSFNRTSFQQQLKRVSRPALKESYSRFNRTSFQQQLKQLPTKSFLTASECFNRTSFQQQLKRRDTQRAPVRFSASIVHPFNNN